MLNYFKSSISRKITGTFSLFLLLVTMIIIFYNSAAQEKNIRKSLDRYIIAVAEILAFTSGSAMSNLDMKAIGEIFEWSKQDKSIHYLAIIEKDGNVLATYNPSQLKQDYKSIVEDRTIIEDKENNLLLTSTAIKQEGNILGKIILGYSLDETQTEIARSRSFSLVFIIPLFLLGIGIISFIVSSVIRPVKELSEAASKISDEMGDLSNRVKTGNLNEFSDPEKIFNQVEVNSADEVGNLAKAFNFMTNSIFRATKELNKKNEELGLAIKQLHNVQRQLMEKEKLASLAGLTAGIAHEIRNPLNFVNNFSELNVELIGELVEEVADQKEKLDEDTYDDIIDLLETMGKNAKKISEHGKRADSIISRMLQHSKGKSGEIQPTKLNDFLREYIILAYHGIRAKDALVNIHIETDYDDSIGEINIIPQDLSRVILNIINNACYAAYDRKKEEGEKFMPVIYIRSVDLDDKVEIKIKDNGKGIPPDIKEKIFNPFFTTKPTNEGTGLGLSMSYDIVVQGHKGDIQVNSEPGHFTEFVITLPKNLKTGVLV
jgi:signal transduction histidine kinase